MITNKALAMLMSESVDNIDELPILNKEAAITELGDESLFVSMLESVEDLTMRKSLIQLTIAIDDMNLKLVGKQANSLAGAVSYIHAERVRMLAEKIKAHVESGNAEQVIQDYPQLLIQCIKLKRKVRFELCQKKGS